MLVAVANGHGGVAENLFKTIEFCRVPSSQITTTKRTALKYHVVDE